MSGGDDGAATVAGERLAPDCNPSLLRAIMQQLSQTNPELLQLIRQNQEDFIHLINQPDLAGTAGGEGGSCSASLTDNQELGIGPTRSEDMQDISGSQQDKTIPMEKLKELLECPVCLKLPRKAPIYQCKGGHCLCKDCHGRLTECPLCKRPRGEIRNLVFEQCLTMMSHECKFADYGCLFEDIIEALECHEQDCRYRPSNRKCYIL